MFTDIVGSTRIKREMPGELTSEREAAFRQQIKDPHDTIVKGLVAARGGILVEGTGDGFFIVFSDAEKAVLCAVEIQERITHEAIQTPNGALQIRIGLNSGQAEPKDGNYSASAVDKASRVESNATPGTVYLSRETEALVRGKVRPISTHSAGPHEMKGLESEELFVAVRAGEPVPRLNRPVPSRPNLDQISTRWDVVLIGDDNDDRFNWLKQLLAKVYLNAVQANTFEELQQLARKLADGVTCRVVFLADTLPLSPDVRRPDPRINFTRLWGRFDMADFVCIVTKDQDPDLQGLELCPHLIHLPTFPPTAGEREKIIHELVRVRNLRSLGPQLFG
jgi:class 3 adenylate cyclase